MRFLHHVNHMRGVAIVPVVTVHCISMFDWPAGSTVSALAPLFINVNIMFIFVSGYLFGHMADGLEPRSYLARRFSNIVVPYVLVSAPAILIYLMHLKAHPHLPPEFLDHPPLYLTALFLVTGAHLGPLWFIPVMVIFYLLSFAFLRLADRRATFLALPFLLLVSELVGRPADNLGTLQLALYFAPIYLLGMLFARHAERVDAALRKGLAPVVLVAVLAGAASVALPARGLPVPHLALKAPICIAVYAALLALPDRPIPALDLLARYAFAVFFLHGYLVALGRMLNWRAAHPVPGTVAVLVLATGAVLGASLALAGAAARAAGARSRLVLGS